VPLTKTPDALFKLKNILKNQNIANKTEKAGTKG